ncbi:MAG: DUF4012 domain-containing protein [Candidatus Spechtbacterales bacterium]
MDKNHDANIASVFSVPLDIEKNKFFKNIQGYEPEEYKVSKAWVVGKIRNFAFTSGVIALLIPSAFFVYKGFVAKDEGMKKSIEAYQNFKVAEQELKGFNFYGAEEGFKKAYENLASAEESLGQIGNLTVSIVENLPFSSGADSSISLLRAAKHIAKAGEIASSALLLSPLNGALSLNSFLGLLADTSNKSGYSPDNFSDFGERISLAEADLMIAESELQDVNVNDFPDEFRGSIGELRAKIPVLSSIIKNSKDYSQILAFLLGMDDSRRYLVIFQNSSELRPTGGFIGSYAVINVEGGKLKDMFVDGIYNADGQLTVNVIPPKPFQHIATAWSTHDANWFLDFPTSAKKIMWFYERTDGGKVDGVISLNVEVVEQLLSLTGPISLANYDLVLDAENFRDEIQYEVEVAYDKKENRPKQVLSDFAPIFIARLREAGKRNDKEVLAVFARALEEKNIMLNFSEKKAQKFLEEQGWSGAIHAASNTQQTTNEDYLAVVHSNIGGYKTDKFMDDEVKYDVDIRQDGSVFGHLLVNRTHRGGDSEYWWYNKYNIDYLKVYVPKGAEIISYSGGQRREPQNPADYKKLKFSEDEDISAIESSSYALGPIDIFSEGGKTVFGTWLITNPKKTSVFEIEYKLPLKIDFKNSVGKYELYFQKQPGTRAKANVAITTSPKWQIAWNSFENKEYKQSLVLDTDKAIGYIFKK